MIPWLPQVADLLQSKVLVCLYHTVHVIQTNDSATCHKPTTTTATATMDSSDEGQQRDEGATVEGEFGKIEGGNEARIEAVGRAQTHVVWAQVRSTLYIYCFY
jgi:hypothetical protein